MKFVGMVVIFHVYFYHQLGVDVKREERTCTFLITPKNINKGKSSESGLGEQEMFESC